MTSLLHVPVQAPVETEVVTDADVLVLKRAADRIEEWAWCQGDKNGAVPHALIADRFCIGTALQRAVVDLGYDSDDETYDAILTRCHVALGFGEIAEGLTEWNDAPGRTKQEVVQRLRDAAEKASS